MKLRHQHFQPKSHLPTKEFLNGNKVPDLGQVYCHNEVNLQFIQTYGFDYDYTLANYTPELPNKIYLMLRDLLVERMGYPAALKDLIYDPSFAVRGLHYDVRTGWVMKVDAYHNIQLNTVHFGREPLSDLQEVIRLHHGTHLSPSYMKNNLIQLNDMFSLPEICLLADIIQYFKTKEIAFNPRHLYDDVRGMGESIHSSAGNHPIGIGDLHLEILREVDKYLDPYPSLVGYLERLRKANKKSFLLTNSGYLFINQGMKFLTGSSDWRDLFDVVIVNSKKPSFYQSGRPFRRVKLSDKPIPTGSDLTIPGLRNTIELDMSSVQTFRPGEIYQGGNLKELTHLTGFSGQQVLYFGDHIYSDLVDPSMQQGWRTGAIIDELDNEIINSESPMAKSHLSYLIQLEQLLVEVTTTNSDNEELKKLIELFKEDRKSVRLRLKQAYNERFGSLFRTHHNPTYFSKKVRTFADLYTSKIENLSNYPLNFTFYPKRDKLPHETH